MALLSGIAKILSFEIHLTPAAFFREGGWGLFSQALA